MEVPKSAKFNQVTYFLYRSLCKAIHRKLHSFLSSASKISNTEQLKDFFELAKEYKVLYSLVYDDGDGLSFCRKCKEVQVGFECFYCGKILLKVQLNLNIPNEFS